MSLARELVEQHELLDIAAGLDASSEIGLKLHNISDFVPDLIHGSIGSIKILCGNTDCANVPGET